MKRKGTQRMISAGLLCMMLALASCGKKEPDKETAVKPQTGKEQTEREGQGNLTLIQPQAYSEVDGITLEPGTYLSLIGKYDKTDYWKQAKRGAEQAVSDLNQALGYKGEEKIRLNFSAPAEYESVDEQINILDEELARYPAAVGIAIIDSNACAVQFDLAAENGIPIVAFDSGSDYQGLQSICATNNQDAGRTAAVKLAAQLENKGKVLVFAHDSISTTAKERETGFADAIRAEYPEIEIAEIVRADSLQDVKREMADKKNAEANVQADDEHATKPEEFTDVDAVKYILEQHPDVKGCFATNVTVTQMLLEAVDEMEDEAGKKIIGFDGGEEQLTALEDGRLSGLVVQNPYGMGYAAVIACARSVNNEGNEAVVDTGYVWVTRDNLEDKDIRRIIY